MVIARQTCEQRGCIICGGALRSLAPSMHLRLAAIHAALAKRFHAQTALKRLPPEFAEPVA